MYTIYAVRIKFKLKGKYCMEKVFDTIACFKGSPEQLAKVATEVCKLLEVPITSKRITHDRVLSFMVKGIVEKPTTISMKQCYVSRHLTQVIVAEYYYALGLDDQQVLECVKNVKERKLIEIIANTSLKSVKEFMVSIYRPHYDKGIDKSFLQEVAPEVKTSKDLFRELSKKLIEIDQQFYKGFMTMIAQQYQFQRGFVGMSKQFWDATNDSNATVIELSNYIKEKESRQDEHIRLLHSSVTAMEALLKRTMHPGVKVNGEAVLMKNPPKDPPQEPKTN